jgi:hypothetical protein
MSRDASGVATSIPGVPRIVAVGLLVGLIAAGCAGGGGATERNSTGTSGGSANTTGRSGASTATSAKSGESSQRPIAGRRTLTIRADDGVQATFPAGWYAQPYSESTLTITSFPIHLADARVWSDVPTGGVVVGIYDSLPVPERACREYPNGHGQLRLSHFEPNYESFGAAYRIEFHDHGHDVLVFVSFGGTSPSRAKRHQALAVLNSVRVDPGACPVHVSLSFGTGR